jgi:hypothetical protein
MNKKQQKTTENNNNQTGEKIKTKESVNNKEEQNDQSKETEQIIINENKSENSISGRRKGKNTVKTIQDEEKGDYI